MAIPANLLAGNIELFPIYPLILKQKKTIFSGKLAGAVPCTETWPANKLAGNNELLHILPLI